MDNPADLQHRVNKFYQDVRESDVAYVSTDTKNVRNKLWSTSPTNRENRGVSLKKDIATMPKAEKKLKVFSGYGDPRGNAPPEQIFNSKPHTDARKGRYLADLQKQHTLKTLNGLTSMNSTMIANS